MKVRYDKKVDAAFIRFSSKRPAGGVEIKEGVILHVTDKDEIVALEILEASERLPLRNLFTLWDSQGCGSGEVRQFRSLVGSTNGETEV